MEAMTTSLDKGSVSVENAYDFYNVRCVVGGLRETIGGKKACIDLSSKIFEKRTLFERIAGSAQNGLSAVVKNISRIPVIVAGLFNLSNNQNSSSNRPPNLIIPPANNNQNNIDFNQDGVTRFTQQVDEINTAAAVERSSVVAALDSLIAGLNLGTGRLESIEAGYNLHCSANGLGASDDEIATKCQEVSTRLTEKRTVLTALSDVVNGLTATTESITSAQAIYSANCAGGGLSFVDGQIITACQELSTKLKISQIDQLLNMLNFSASYATSRYLSLCSGSALSGADQIWSGKCDELSAKISASR